MPAAVAPEHTDRREDVVPARTPGAFEPRRPRDRIRLADVIFKALCLLIATFFILFLGLIGGFLYLLG